MADRVPAAADGTFGGFAHQSIELGEGVLDRGEVRTVWREEEEACPVASISAHIFGALKLPSYAPELNSAENIWEHLQKNKLATASTTDDRAIVDACCQAWNDFVADPALVTSVTRRGACVS